MSLGIIDSCIISSFICHKGGGGSVSLCGTLVCSCGPALLVRLACVSTPTCIASSARRSTIVSTYLPAVCPLCGLWSSYAGPLCIRQDAITIIQGGGGGGGGRLLMDSRVCAERSEAHRKAERSEALHDSKYLLSP